MSEEPRDICPWCALSVVPTGCKRADDLRWRAARSFTGGDWCCEEYLVAVRGAGCRVAYSNDVPIEIRRKIIDEHSAVREDD